MYRKDMEIINELIIHKKYVLDCCLKMAKYLYNNNQEQLGLEIVKRGLIHDNSKLEKEELDGLKKINDNNKSLKDPNAKISAEVCELLKVHWKNNRHHPEYHQDINKMEEIDIIEMCCDWCARSIQYNTNLMEFVTIRQKTRFHFNDEIYEKIVKYCNILIGG